MNAESEKSSNALNEALMNCDYLTLPMKEDKESPVFFNEAVKSARYYKNLMETISKEVFFYG